LDIDEPEMQTSLLLNQLDFCIAHCRFEKEITTRKSSLGGQQEKAASKPNFETASFLQSS